jgi:peptide/nickel transport system ATP-binding protein
MNNTSPTPDWLLEVGDLRTSFRTSQGLVRAVDGVSINLARGRTLGIVGESGSGKSVFARSLMNLLPSSAETAHGTVRFDGVDLRGMATRDIRKLWGAEIAMVFQDPMTSLNPVVRVGRQITEGVRFHTRLSQKQAKEHALQLLADVGIPDPRSRLDVYPHQMSGGMRQRVAIAIALACSPKLLLADEPTTALDVTIQRQILDLLQRLQADRGMAMILITHDLGVAAGRTDEIAVMYAGRVVERAPTTVLFDHMSHPYTQALLASIPRLEYDVHTRLNTIPGRPPDLIGKAHGCSFSARCPYVQPRCLSENPVLEPATGPGHVVACFYPVGPGRDETTRLSVGAKADSVTTVAVKR